MAAGCRTDNVWKRNEKAAHAPLVYYILKPITKLSIKYIAVDLLV